jgi:hypothetical protein
VVSSSSHPFAVGIADEAYVACSHFDDQPSALRADHRVGMCIPVPFSVPQPPFSIPRPGFLALSGGAAESQSACRGFESLGLAVLRVVRCGTTVWRTAQPFSFPAARLAPLA